MRLLFSTKAETLEQLAPIIKKAIILPQIRCSVSEWEKNKNKIVKKILSSSWGKEKLIVRSSAFSEDSINESKAGEFLSVLEVHGKNQVFQAIEKVMNSFKKKKENNPKNQIFVQPQVKNVLFSGVAFSKCPNLSSPYIVINYDEETKSTDSVTAGRTNNLKTFYYFKVANVSLPFPINLIIELINELENLYSSDEIDIEFCITKDKKIYLFQIRPLVNLKKLKKTPKALNEKILNIYNKIKKMNQLQPYLFGSKTVFGIMPDWNPAEIIGIRPNPLALSIYKELITDHIWAYQRNNYGYKNLRSFPLLLDFCGLPYIDVRVSFNSFLPNDLEENLSHKLINYYINKLIQTPSFHDKVEFEIIFSCYTLDLPKRISCLKEHGFNDQEINILMNKLRLLTNNIIDKENGIWKKDIKKIEILKNRYSTIINSSLDIVSKIYWLLEDCKRYGTLPFAGLARAGFIAVQFLQSLVNENIFSTYDYSCFFNSLNTISSSMNNDFVLMDKNNFLNKYGHLRPGTYNLLSPSYGENPNLYFNWRRKNNKLTSSKKKFVLSLDQMKKIENLLRKHGLNHNIISFFDFIIKAIEGREYAKFVFTRSLNSILILFKEFAKSHQISIYDCIFANIEIIKKSYESSEDGKTLLKNSINHGKDKFEYTKSILLPPLIINPEDVFAFSMPKEEPNYITQLSAKGPLVLENDKKVNFNGAILFIESADPGYDWIFSHKIKGFVTKYGGINSHMAIRAAELQIPAIIGAGENLYSKWILAKYLEIDCMNKVVNIIR